MVKMKSTGGFSLVELMVVVAIIGVLAAVAVPQYRGFQNKARQSEAKVSLGALASAEESFRVENQSYLSCLNTIGFLAPTGSLYGYGFTAAHLATYQAQGNPGAANTVTVAAADCLYGSANNASSAAAPANILAASTGTAAGTFTAAAVVINALNGATIFDQWIINENRVLTNNRPGIN